ncbi:thioesterase family protein [Tamlana fucoidanivorans]|uniref:Thioesterase n=1 Tax=Allotamlana fucoidanivorans TaxID=2583814 RepID=A0A5C4SEF1_9FLAO|nr:thioesterase family protein [Tamlana fucoidanivorans]TNJ41343.1 thioesterase [Tamlana fucoidanivorans]
MIYYWLHVLYIFIGSRLFWKRIKPDHNLTRQRIVSLFDCESFRYMANSKYFYYMDLIRYEIVFRSQLYNNTIKKGMFGVLASQKIIYKKPLKRWTKFSITLVLDGYDDKWVYHKQIFKQKGEICAIGFTKAGFWKHKKAQNMTDILLKSGVHHQTKVVSSETLDMFKNDYDILKKL